MKPYYQDDHYGITIYNGDCRDVLTKLAPVDLVLTDPPYGIFKNINSDGIMFGKPTIYSEDKKATEWDKKPERDLLVSIRDFGICFTIWGGELFCFIVGRLQRNFSVE
jgi:DNA modification methylase